MGKGEPHVQALLMVAQIPVPDLPKPAYSFEVALKAFVRKWHRPYVKNWACRTAMVRSTISDPGISFRIGG